MEATDRANGATVIPMPRREAPADSQHPAAEAARLRAAQTQLQSARVLGGILLGALLGSAVWAPMLIWALTR